MSNFDFLNNKAFLKHPSCEFLYKHAIYAEAICYDHGKCAQEARFILEQLCIFVSDLNNASYPAKVSTVGSYCSPKNVRIFTSIFGDENVRLIKRTNRIANSFLHITLVSREDVYPEMLENVYKLLLWLYKKLGFDTPLRYSDYSTEKIPPNALSIAEPPKDINYSSKELTQHLKDFFPNINTDQFRSLPEPEDHSASNSGYNSPPDNYVEAEKYQNSESERIRLQEQLEQTGKQFEAVKKDFLEQQSIHEELILKLKKQITDLEEQNRISGQQSSQEISSLQTRLLQQNEKHTMMSRDYKKSLEELGNQYDLLQEKYEELIPLKERELQMQQQIKDLIMDRAEQEKAFSNTNEKLLEEISGVKQRLAAAQQTLLSMNTSARENQELIRRLENGLAEKEKELSAAKKLAGKKLNALQAETREIIKRYKDKANSLDIILTNVLAENAGFRESAIDYRHTEETKNYLLLVNHSISEMEQGYALYQKNKNEQLLRDYLRKVKSYYDNKIESLEKALRDKEEKLAQERQKNNELFEALWKEKAAVSPQKNASDSETRAAGNNDSVPIRAHNKSRRKKCRKLLTALWASSFVLAALLFPMLYREHLSDKARKTNSAPEDPATGSVQSNTMAMLQNSSRNTENAETILPEETAAPVENSLPEETAMPVENSLPEETAIPEKPDTYPFPETSSAPQKDDKDTEQRQADQILAADLLERERLDALPDAIEEINGVSQDLLDDMEAMREIFDDFDKTAYNYRDTENYRLIGRHTIWHIVHPIYQTDFLKSGKFVFTHQSTYCMTAFALAVEPDAISADISYHTSLAELELLLGKANVTEYTGEKPTDFSEQLPDQKYYTATFKYLLEKGVDSAHYRYQRIIFVYNEDMTEIMDYAYVYEDMKQ